MRVSLSKRQAIFKRGPPYKLKREKKERKAVLLWGRYVREKVGALIKGCWCPNICCQLWKGGCEAHCIQSWLALSPAYSGISGQWPLTVERLAPGPGIRELSFLCLIDISHRISLFMHNPNPCGVGDRSKNCCKLWALEFPRTKEIVHFELTYTTSVCILLCTFIRKWIVWGVLERKIAL